MHAHSSAARLAATACQGHWWKIWRSHCRRLSRHLATDVLVVGAGMGGCAAAWACLRQGQRVVLTEENDWIGGQMTAQAVPPDEHPWIEQFGCTRSYRRVRHEIRRYYR